MPRHLSPHQVGELGYERIHLLDREQTPSGHGWTLRVRANSRRTDPRRRGAALPVVSTDPWTCELSSVKPERGAKGTGASRTGQAHSDGALGAREPRELEPG